MKGRILCDFPPKPGNPRNSEGSFGRLPNGKLLFVFSRFHGGNADDAAADLVMLSSDDDGYTWKEEGVIFSTADADALNLMSITLLTMNNGDLGLFYLIRKTDFQMQAYMRRTTDGIHWSEPVVCIPQEGYYVINNDRVTRLQSGRIIIPAAYHRKGQRLDTGTIYWDSIAETIFYYSDDDGYTWKASNKSALPYSAYCKSGLQEPGVLEYPNGVLYGWARTELGRQYEMYSIDQGETWTAPQPSRFTSPNSPLSMKYLPDGRILAVWNPIPLYNGRPDHYDGCWTGGRTPLVYALSSDNGRTWTEPVAIEDAPDHGYCYTAIYPAKEHVLLAYCAGGPEDQLCLARLRLRSIPYSEL